MWCYFKFKSGSRQSNFSAKFKKDIIIPCRASIQPSQMCGLLRWPSGSCWPWQGRCRSPSSQTKKYSTTAPTFTWPTDATLRPHNLPLVPARFTTSCANAGVATRLSDRLSAKFTCFFNARARVLIRRANSLRRTVLGTKNIDKTTTEARVLMVEFHTEFIFEC